MSSSDSPVPSGHRSVRDRAPTPYPVGPLDSSSESDPSERSDDSSIQILPPPSPQIIDLIDSPDQIIVIPDSPTLSEDDQVVPVCVAASTTPVPTPDMYRHEVPELVISEPMEDSQLSPVRSTAPLSEGSTAPVSGTPIMVSTFADLLTPSAPIYVETPTVPTVPDFTISPVGSAPACDTAPPAPAVHMPAPVVRIPSAPPFPVQSVGMPMQPIVDREPVPWVVHDHLFQQFRWVWIRYEEVFATRDAILRLLSVDPATVHGGGSVLMRDVPMEIVHQISISILTGLRTDITALPSSSTGAVDRSAVTDLITRAIEEFQRRVGEMFGL